ncbi:class I SAM-dependent methyltransferase [Streptomyces uncialis]|uniref:class I SAM-dependent methyltransferase n=1 Tax=Streptomyces uncialis TaxID=1048205 RepID=UPI002E36D043|nr:class I SAM-dependent methyltransferase [Streptomyces uncialis]
MSQTGTGTTGAYEHWDQQWRQDPAIAEWSRADPDVVAVGTRIRDRGGQRSLDVGCGVGRHTLALASLGFESYGVDRSEAGLERVLQEANRRGATVELRSADMTSLPFPGGSFDFVVAWNVVYHGTAEDAARAIAEVTRVLRPGGRYLSTMLSKRNVEFGKGQEIAADTFVQPGGPQDKAHPHLYCDADDLLALHPGLALLSAVDREHSASGSYHWHLQFDKPVSI